MKHVFVLTMLFATASAHAEVNAAKAKSAIGKSDCMACHAVNNRIVGPGYKEIAAKYQGDKKAVAVLAKRVRTGSSGIWGAVPMPAHPDLSDADAKLIVEWILAGAK
jgi:cytochrome c